MNDPKRMYLIYSLANLPHNKRNFGLRQRLCLFELMIKLSSRSNFQNDVNIKRIMKASIHFDDIRMIKIELDFEFSNELLDNIFILDKLLLDHFQSADKS
jgi:hypothetical protein